MERPEISHVFDSDMQFLDAPTFDEVVMNEVELFSSAEFDDIVNELQSWDTKSLVEMQTAMFSYLQTRNGDNLKLAMNMVLDHCMLDSTSVDDFKVYLLTNTLEWMINVREMEAMGVMGRPTENTNEEQE